jgi:hypothetical protein
MGKNSLYANSWLWKLLCGRPSDTTRDQNKGKSGGKSTITRRMIGSVLYFLTPESSIRTGFEKPIDNKTNQRMDRQGKGKIIFCLLLSILIGSIIAQLV